LRKNILFSFFDMIFILLLQRKNLEKNA